MEIPHEACKLCSWRCVADSPLCSCRGNVRAQNAWRRRRSNCYCYVQPLSHLFRTSASWILPWSEKLCTLILDLKCRWNPGWNFEIFLSASGVFLRSKSISWYVQTTSTRSSVCLLSVTNQQLNRLWDFHKIWYRSSYKNVIEQSANFVKICPLTDVLYLLARVGSYSYYHWTVSRPI